MEEATTVYVKTIHQIRKQIYSLSSRREQEEIIRTSPYSSEITPHIQKYGELRLYCIVLQLRETFITRPALIRNINFDLWVSTEKCTNLDLMKKGCAPYAYDAPEGKIELHHIGQDFSAPFAELTWEEHNEKSKLLHPSQKTSWRQNKKLEDAFYRERKDYWQKRASQEYPVTEYEFHDIPLNLFKKQADYMDEICKTCELLYEQCQPKDLDYLSDLAKSYAMMQRVGATSLNEFLQDSSKKCKKRIRCTSCNSDDYILYGTYQTTNERIQRYKCRHCGKVFSPFQNSLISGSSFSFREWIKFIDCLYNGYTIDQIAKACGISDKTAHENRIKLFYALKLLNDKVQLRGNIVLDETYLPVSYKGNHSKEDFVMPREAHRRGGENHKKGLSKNLVSIVCAVDEFGNSVAKITGTGPASGLKLKYALQDHLSNEVTCLYSDKSSAIQKFAELCEYEVKQEKLLRKNGKTAKNITFNKDTLKANRYLQVMNSYHSRFKKFLSRFSGTSTKYLSGYLYLFAWRERSKDLESEDVYRELLHILTQPNNYIPVEQIMQSDHFPDARSIDKQYRVHTSPNLERNKEIYRRFAAGETMGSIGADIGMSVKNVRTIIRQMRQNGLAYRTQRDVQREQKSETRPNRFFNESHQRIISRNIQIYQERLRWEGSSNAFNEEMGRKHHLSATRVKNIVSEMRRIQRLKDEIFVYEDVSYRSSKEVYQAVYADWLERSGDPQLPKSTIAATLADKYGFSPTHIQWIVQIMSNDSVDDYFIKKRKLTKAETHNRDKALFIEFLRWCGTKKDFCAYASKKYNVSNATIYTIIQFCFCADPSRCDMA